MPEKMPSTATYQPGYELSHLPSSRLGADVDADADSEPLLPVYSPTSSSPPTAAKPLSPHQRHLLHTRQSRMGRALKCLCLSLLIVIPTMGLLGCAFGERAVKRVKGWDQVPDEWKVWLGDILADKAGGHADYGMFPTESAELPLRRSWAPQRGSADDRQCGICRTDPHRSRVSPPKEIGPNSAVVSAHT